MTCNIRNNRRLITESRLIKEISSADNRSLRVTYTGQWTLLTQVLVSGK